MGGDGNHCSFVLLAEFHLLEGAQLKYQFPQPLGIDEGALATSMLPDGAETQSDDWTIFFLNQTSFNTISPVLALESPEVKSVSLPDENADGDGDGRPDLLYVLNLVRTKRDKALDRGAKVLALAICTRHSFIQIFKPVLLMALDDYLTNPSQDCLSRLFDAVNSMDLSGAPKLTRYEKIVLRYAERKDMFEEKFPQPNLNLPPPPPLAQSLNGNGYATPPVPPAKNVNGGLQHRSTNSGESYSSFEEGIMMRTQSQSQAQSQQQQPKREGIGRDRADTESSTNTAVSQTSSSSYNGTPNTNTNTNPPGSPSDSSFSLGGSAVLVGDESGLDTIVATDQGDTNSVFSLAPSGTLAGSSIHNNHSGNSNGGGGGGGGRGRRSTDGSSNSSHLKERDRERGGERDRERERERGEARTRVRSGTSPFPGAGTSQRDTHFFNTTVKYKDHVLPIKMPLSTFAEEVGDYSLRDLVKVFSSHQLVSGPHHPHLHTNGPQTHPIIILFNALVTGKRVIFLGHKRPAGEVSNFVLAACALGSGCGTVLRGFIERAFPYATLNNKDEWESVPAYIAGVTNPIFEASRAWDLLLDISTGSVTVSKDIHATYPVTTLMTLGQPLIARSGTVKAESTGVDERGEFGKVDREREAGGADSLFIDDIKASIEDHAGEPQVRLRFVQYVTRFVRLASRYEEEVSGTTRFGYPSAGFVDASGSGGGGGIGPQLGSGMVFFDEGAGMRELNANAQRIEAWRGTESYRYYCKDFAKAQPTRPIRGYDVYHQVNRLVLGKKMPDNEVLLIMRTFAESVRTYDQVVELLSYLPPQQNHTGGLLPIGFGLFHQREAVRDAVVELFNQLRLYPVGIKFLQSLNHFQRYAYVRLAYAKEKRTLELQQQLGVIPSVPAQPGVPVLYPPSLGNRSYSNSVSSVSGHSNANGIF